MFIQIDRRMVDMLHTYAPHILNMNIFFCVYKLTQHLELIFVH